MQWPTLLSRGWIDRLQQIEAEAKSLKDLRFARDCRDIKGSIQQKQNATQQKLHQPLVWAKCSWFVVFALVPGLIVLGALLFLFYYIARR